MDWKYIAGFFDGEGSVVHNGKGFRVTIAQTNKEVLEEIKRFAAVGHIITVKKKKSHWKDSWVFYVAKQRDVLLFLKKVSKFSIVKVSLVNKTIPLLEKTVQAQIDREKKLERLIKEAKKLRKNGLTYRQIGVELKIDFGHARRLALK